MPYMHNFDDPTVVVNPDNKSTSDCGLSCEHPSALESWTHLESATAGPHDQAGNSRIAKHNASHRRQYVRRSLRDLSMLLGVDDAIIHLGRNSRTFSAGTTCPDSESRIPSSRAASVSSSSRSTIGSEFSKSNFSGLAISAH